MFQKLGKQGLVKELNAVGSKWTKAVAINTPVPKCLEMKRKWRGMGSRGNRRAKIGNEHADSRRPSLTYVLKDVQGAAMRT